MDNSVIIKTESDEASHRKTINNDLSLTEPVSENEPDENYETDHESTEIIFQHPLPIKTEPAWQINCIQLTDDQVPSHGMGIESSQSSVRQSLDVKTENPDCTIGQSLEVNTHNSDSEMYSMMQINIEPGSVRSLDIKFEVNVNDDEDKVQPLVLNCGDAIKTEMGDDSVKQFKIEPGSSESLDVEFEEHHAIYLASADNSVKREDEFMQTDYVVKQEQADADDDNVCFVSSRSWMDDDNIDAAAANLEMRRMGKSRAEIQKAYRERKKLNDPTFLEKERKRQADYRIPAAELSEKKLKKRRQKDRGYCSTYRQTKKLEKEPVESTVDRNEVSSANAEVQSHKVSSSDPQPTTSTRASIRSAGSTPMLVRFNLPCRTNSSGKRRSNMSKALRNANQRVEELSAENKRLNQRLKKIQKRLQKKKSPL